MVTQIGAVRGNTKGLARDDAAGVPAARVVLAGRLDINRVSHAYALSGEALPVLDDVSFTAEPGDFVALLGPSGCGKSTLLRLVAGLDTPLSGTVAYNGSPITGPDPHRVVVFQDPTLYPWLTVRRNVALGPAAQGLRDADGRINEALEKVGLTAFANAYPHQLSGGMAQRAALARALVNDPSLLILDEPFGKLDSLTRLRMQSELLSLWSRARFTSLLVTHDVEEALFMATRVIVFSDRPARIIADITNDRPYPRHRDDPHLVTLRKQVLEQLGVVSA
jgi:NitT/TauT family transport system ATP-binding protein